MKPEILCYGHFGCRSDARDGLSLMRQKVLSWLEIIRPAVGAGKRAEDIFGVIRENDRDLDYLNHLDADSYGREYVLLVNSVMGLAEYAGKQG